MISPWAYLRAAAGKARAAYREGRLAASPRQWLVHLRNLRREMEDGPPAPPEPVLPRGQSKADVTARAGAELQQFLASGARLTLPAARDPAVSIVLVLYNRAELTLACLRSIIRHAGVPAEVVIVDNASTDSTAELLAHTGGATILRNQTNLGFLDAVNQAARVARGRHLLLLNNDAELLEGTLAAAVAALEDATVGAVGGPIVALDGQLQEAGSIIWRDGSCLGYGRGQSPHAYEFQFVRDVDYCSGAFLLTPRERFLSLGGFDERYRPAYYEDADYCARLWQAGLRVVYEPRAAICHFEFASSTSREDAIRLQAEHQRIFAARHADWLARQKAAGQVLAARARPPRGLRVLFLDDRVPREGLGAGFPRALAMVRALVEAGHFVTVLPLSHPDEPRDDGLPRTVEVAGGIGAAGLEAFLRARTGYYDRILVSRPHNMQRLRAATERFSIDTPIVYDAEALYALRDHTDVDRELALAEPARAVIAVSEAERSHFAKSGHARTLTVGHALAATPTAPGFAERSGLLFVGALYDEASPNVDALVWFARAILPLLPSDIALTAVGRSRLSRVEALAGPRVQLAGHVEDLLPHYSRARIFIAPTRSAAGLPYKVHHAAAHGLPVVATSLLARQLGWQDGRELSVADGAEAFAQAIVRLYHDGELWRRLREGALARIAIDCDPGRFRDGLAAALA